MKHSIQPSLEDLIGVTITLPGTAIAQKLEKRQHDCHLVPKV